MNKTIFVLLFIFLIVGCYPSFAARPLITDDFNTVSKGKYEIELGSYSSQPSVGVGVKNSVSVSAKYGILDNADIGIEIPYSFGTIYGFNDISISSKFKLFLFNEEDGSAIKSIIKLGNADSISGLGSGYNNYGLVLIFSGKIFDFISHYNLGYTIVGIPNGALNSNEINYGFALERKIYKNAELVFEISGKSVNSDKSYINVQIGSKWQIEPTYRVDVGYSVDIDNNSQDVTTIGVTFEF